MSNPFVAVIPARLASTRLPGKPLADIAGKPMVIHVADRARESGACEVVIAADHADVIDAARRHGVRALMTRADHASGSDRLAEVVEQLALDDAAIVVNVQGDEPCIDPALIRIVAETLAARSAAEVATAAHPIADAAEFFSPNVVKVVRDASGLALYFSRAPIPFARDAFAAAREALPAGFPALRHIGIYAYRAGFLRHYAALPVSPLENFEALEQLRVLHHGARIAVALWEGPLSPGVDTAQDLERVRAMFPARIGGYPPLV